MNQKPFDFFNDHSLHFLEMALTSDRMEKLDSPDGYGKNTGDCGDTVEMFLKVGNDRLEKITFLIHGCMNTHACANTIANFLEGKTLKEAWDVTPEKVADFLETLPKNHFHCAELAVGALYRALGDCAENSQRSWKKLYQKH
ncbi:MAG: iron-sulfur cluster assembly scaffold protein [Proteobacteria bacterium]|nr:iron-sulfur cluster assembly scaffold protein [Pseudomonadota bacterium]